MRGNSAAHTPQTYFFVSQVVNIGDLAVVVAAAANAVTARSNVWLTGLRCDNTTATCLDEAVDADNEDNFDDDDEDDAALSDIVIDDECVAVDETDDKVSCRVANRVTRENDIFFVLC